MCTGRAPFRGRSTIPVLKRVCEETPQPIREINSEIPQWLADIVERLHAKKPDERFASAQEVADLLGKYLSEIQLHGQVAAGQQGRLEQATAGLPPAAVDTPAAHPKTPVGRSAGRLAWTLATTLLAFAACVGFALYVLNQDQRPAGAPGTDGPKGDLAAGKTLPPGNTNAIGPGAADEKWKQTPNDQHGLMKTGQLATKTNPTLAAAKYPAALDVYPKDEELLACRAAVLDNPGDALVHKKLGDALLKWNKVREKALLDEAEAAFDKAARLQPLDHQAYSGLANCYAFSRRWSKALAAFEHSIQLNPDSDWSWLCLATLRLYAGDTKGYRTACGEVLKRFEAAQSYQTWRRAAFACALGTDAVDDPGRVLKLATIALKQAEKDPGIRIYHLTAALAAYRAGRFADAVTAVEAYGPKTVGWGNEAIAFAVLAMAQHRLGEKEKAHAALASAAAILDGLNLDSADGPLLGTGWHDVVWAHILLREAQGLLGTTASAQGKNMK
jgi:tetratricopeptide (TPR) repeat protein